MSPSSLHERASDLALAVEIASNAGDIALDRFGHDRAGWDKADGSPVSATDLAVNAYLKGVIAAARPDDGWLSEECADSEARLHKRRLWVVDPIDGTRDFLRGRSGWAVSVALVEDGAVTVGVLAAPAQDRLYAASAGAGATLNGKRLQVSGLATLDGVRLPMDAANLTASYWPSPWPGTAVAKPNSLALRMAMLASAEADAWAEGRTIPEWDVAAASLILAEAGGTISDRHGAPLRFNRPRPLIAGLAAATPALHGEVLFRLDHALKAFAARRQRA
ncbi:3'(2'),5'-bisphosphate nucleotidase CysQ [Sandarakinorhabdus rubra]|uniref:3'(2'),5'-bisphosphate nucleotidase CysQ n=1 Tax=Sandarakinorhabdus rubra TaxID=2672568 RepID=UPI001F2A412A|nr:3'(2'),5'-bisphosphate nucleotidase CysQ [Sandarakinorhabdus rubra]